MATIVDSYSESNNNASSTVWFNGATINQSFTGDGGTLSASKLYLKKFNGTTGNIVCKIYLETHSTAYGTDSIPTGSVLATSDTIDASTISGDSFSLITFTFSGVNKITLENATKYVLVCIATSGDINTSVGYDSTSPTHDGNQSRWGGSSWSAQASADTCFYVYKDDVTSIVKDVIGRGIVPFPR